MRSLFHILLLLLASCSATQRPSGAPAAGTGDDAFLDDVQRRTFNWFWETTNPQNGLTPDRWPSRPFASIAAVGFALTAYPVGVERGYITRAQAAERTLNTLRFFWRAPQGPGTSGVTGYKGFFYHFLDMEDGTRFQTTELSTIDTALLLGGVLFAQSYFDGSNAIENEVRALADSIYLRVEWPYFQTDHRGITMAWRPESNRLFGPARWTGYDESVLLHVLALGSPTHPGSEAIWNFYTSHYNEDWGEFYGQEHLQFAPLFGHQYSHVWIDFRGIQDDFMRRKGLDYFENSRRATLAQRQYAIANPSGFRGYDSLVWGLTASDGPKDTLMTIEGKQRRFHTYWARGARLGDIRDDGTIAPTAAGGSVPFAPEITIPALRAMRDRYGDHLYQQYGFLDAFNPTLNVPVQTRRGAVVPGVGWFDSDYIGIDQGPILLMIENHRSGFIWETMKRNPHIIRGLCRTGFRGGWLAGKCAARDNESTLVDSLVARMTLEEKAGQLNQSRGQWSNTGPSVPEVTDADIRAGRIGSLIGVFGAELTRETQRVAVEETRMGIPLLLAHDVIHGFRTLFPVSIGEASSWNPAAVEKSARIAATEATAHGLNWTYAPMVDIARDPRWGRIVEGAGEDPYLGSVMAAARVRGFQGNDLTASNTMLATAKHFVAYGAAEGGRDYNIADVPERTLHEVYLPPFRAAVDAGAQSVMAAFNEVAGVPMHAHDELIDGVLRAQWNFDGVLVSDFTGIMELLHHGIARDTAHAVKLALEAGVDVDLMASFYLKELPRLVREGKVGEEDLNEAVRRVLRAKYRLGLFDDPYRYSDPERQRTLTLHPDHIAFARELARESIVLLKNERNLLPLSRSVRTIAVVGPLANDARSALGSWAAAGRPEDAITPLAGIKRAVPNANVIFAPGAVVEGNDTSGFVAAIAAARRADVVVAVVGEHHDMSAEARNRTSLELPGTQLQLLQRLRALGKPIVGVLTNGRPLSISWMDQNIPAILETWYLGVQAGPALADVLFGDYNPSGKLPVTFPRNVGQVPIYYNHKNTGRPPAERERYTSKYIDVPWTPLYVFGHGLSYTTFSYSAPRLSRATIQPGQSLSVEVTVTNTGPRAGAEVVQLYLRDDVATITRPVRELRGFRKVELAPGASQTVQFQLTPRDLSMLNSELQRVIEPGTFTVWVGGSSATDNAASFRVEEP